jgi:hypothetical protein
LIAALEIALFFRLRTQGTGQNEEQHRNNGKAADFGDTAMNHARQNCKPESVIEITGSGYKSILFSYLV